MGILFLLLKQATAVKKQLQALTARMLQKSSVLQDFSQHQLRANQHHIAKKDAVMTATKDCAWKTLLKEHARHQTEFGVKAQNVRFLSASWDVVY